MSSADMGEEEDEDYTWTAGSIAWELVPFFGTLSRQEFDPIELAYIPS